MHCPSHKLVATSNPEQFYPFSSVRKSLKHFIDISFVYFSSFKRYLKVYISASLAVYSTLRIFLAHERKTERRRIFSLFILIYFGKTNSQEIYSLNSMSKAR